MTSSPQLRALGEALGTEALGIDLSKPLDEATSAWVGRAFAEHPVLVFRDQDLGAAGLADFGRRFGTPRMHALIKYRHADYPEVSWLTNVEDDGKVDWYGGQACHRLAYRFHLRRPSAAARHPAREGSAVRKRRHDVCRHARSI